MAAGGLSYSMITNYGKATLPSVDSWGTNMSMLRDPPKSITTRKIDKVGQTSDITEMIDNSGDRACEAISVYSRGINPMVSVMYQNSGKSASGTMNSGQQAYPPYIIDEQGSFRPPVLRQENLYPLSRLPRIWTYAFTNPEFPDFSKKTICQGEASDYRAVHNKVLQVSVRPTAVYKIEKPIQENYNMKYVIQNPPTVSAHSGIRFQDKTTQHVNTPTKNIIINPMHSTATSNTRTENRPVSMQYNIEPTKQIIKNPIHGTATAQIGSSSTVTHINNSTFDSDPYIQHTLHSNVEGRISKNMQITPISELMDLDIHTKNKININYTTPQTSFDKVNYIHKDINLDRNIPSYKTTTNVSKNIHKTMLHENTIELDRNLPAAEGFTNIGRSGYSNENSSASKDYNRLPQKPQYGGFAIPPSKPELYHDNNVREYESERAIMSRKVNESMQGRFTR